MQNLLSSLLIISFFISCGSPEAPDKNIEEEPGVVEFVGEMRPDELKSADYKEWYQPTYEAYVPDSAALVEMSDPVKEVKITLFFGTWCSDSHREVPALMKLLEKVDYDFSNLKIIAVDEEKTEPAEWMSGYQIEYVPTIILSRDETELGRIVETPKVSLEKDMLSLLLAN